MAAAGRRGAASGREAPRVPGTSTGTRWRGTADNASLDPPPEGPRPLRASGGTVGRAMRYAHTVERARVARKPATLIPEFFGSLLFTHNSSRYLPFDDESTGVLRELVGTPFPEVHARWARDRDADSVAALEGFFEGLDDL